MPRPFINSTLPAALILVLWAFAPSRPAPQTGAPPTTQEPPSEEVLRARADELIAKQHRGDLALQQYERIERVANMSAGRNPRLLEEKTYRIVPAGIGTLKLLLKADGKPVDPAFYHKQLLAWQEALELALKPGDPRARTAYAKWQKREKERAGLVDATRHAFRPKWLGSETRNGRSCDVYELDPDSSFHPQNIWQDAMRNVRGKIWVDKEATQLVRGEVLVFHDISFGAGIFGKLYRGSMISVDQAPVAPGLWLPTRYQYDYSGRKFVFGFEEHQIIEAGPYRYIGPPQQALEVVKSELSSGRVVSGDP